jgi:hypothetical protein
MWKGLLSALFGAITLKVSPASNSFSFVPGPRTDAKDILTTWDVLGDASIVGHVLRLTPDAQSKSGAAVARDACVSCRSGFESYASFHLHGAGATLVGDGVALWFTQHRPFLRPGGLFGADARYSGVGVFLSTYTGSGGLPRLAVVRNDGTEIVSAPGAAANGNYQSSLHPPAVCTLTRHLDVKSILTIRVRYHTRRLELHYILGVAVGDYVDRDVRDWEPCAVITDADFVAEPQGIFVSASAATGDLSQNHDLVELITIPEEDGVRIPGAAQSVSSGSAASRSTHVMDASPPLDPSIRATDSQQGVLGASMFCRWCFFEVTVLHYFPFACSRSPKRSTRLGIASLSCNVSS